MKAVLTKVEVIGKTKAWGKINFFSPSTGEAGNAIIPVELMKGLEEEVIELEDVKPSVDLDFNQQGRISGVELLNK
jgi:hypothetical protein